MYKKLQYISQGNTVEAQLYNIQKALDSGCDWIQLRFKTKTPLTLTFAKAVKEICNGYKATLIINDNVYLAQQIAADGVHLGLTDMGIPEARRILGTYKIIGATANTLKMF
jgi:thiamine-phosphate pyrophosphorylase